jgi:hypothetical protein
VSEPARQRREPLADRVRPEGGATIRRPGRTRTPAGPAGRRAARRAARSGRDGRVAARPWPRRAAGAARCGGSWGPAGVLLRQALGGDDAAVRGMVTVIASRSRSSQRSAQTSDGRSPAVVLSRRNTARSAICGGQGRDRTADLAVFSRTLYRLSYLPSRPGLRVESLGPTPAVPTGFEPATSALTGRRAQPSCSTGPRCSLLCPQRSSNPRRHLERVVS